MISSDLEKYINLCNERERLIDDNIILYNCTREEAISFVDYNLINEIDTFGKKISIELNKSQLKTENINGLNFIYGNDIERYFAVKFANENKELNKFIDKKIKIEVDKDVTNNSIIINELDDTIIIHTGVLNKFDVEKSMYISSKPELVEGYISEQYIPSLKNGLSSSFNSSLKDFYKNIPIIKDVINSLLNQFEDSIVDDLTVDVVSKKMSREEVISLALDFFKKVDKTGKLAEELLASINEGKVILFDNDEQKNEFVKNNYISMSENSSRVDPDSELIFIDSKYNSEDFVTLIHEFMHYNSVTNAKKNNSDMGASYFREFASIYFEYLARDFAKERGIDNNFSILRAKGPINNLMSTLFSIELIDSYLKNNLDVNYIVSLMKKYNISIKDLNHFKADDILYIIYEAVPYIWGLLMTKHSFNDGISPDVIKDVSDHLYDYSFEEIMDKLNMSDYLLDGNKEKTTSIGR